MGRVCISEGARTGIASRSRSVDAKTKQNVEHSSNEFQRSFSSMVRIGITLGYQEICSDTRRP